ncbi:MULTISPECIES: cupin domain-containing protein [unclassified Pseudomonas]|uniref:cupin domain-containing protein n=1 Tax=unclassified Pseudomonas TaxID=196821 RepID=UPI002AC9E2B1|nr:MULTISPECIES: cupin domain-containing protein [unclassified Pseudomonas]MEB0040489.1 cupin domain-containing protein [Pseudomonas sp. MH10]MEB0121258.1 cupin domain-containing protein [Pseudomonas sp. CCI1.2]WPX66178.1 cupin domain-containing protein [Pseudomonas sp. MH10]
MQTFHKQFESAYRLFSVGIWECSVGSFTVSFTEHEFASLLEGRIMIEDEQGTQVLFLPGMQLVFTAGYRGEWNVLEPSRKAYVCYELNPPAL